MNNHKCDPAGLPQARHVVLVASADDVVAVDGGAATLMEIAAAWQRGRPVIALRGAGWSLTAADPPPILPSK